MKMTATYDDRRWLHRGWGAQAISPVEEGRGE
jgi:hypothetical protein